MMCYIKNAMRKVISLFTNEPYTDAHEYVEIERIINVDGGYRTYGLLRCKKCGKIDPVPTSVDFNWGKYYGKE